MSKRRALVLMVLLLSSAAVTDDLAEQASVIDGDTLEIHGTRIRLWGIDAPESSQLCRNDSSSLYPRDIEIMDRFGNLVTPREWFLVPLGVGNEAVDRIKYGTVTDYRYDPKTAALVRIGKG